MPDYMEIILRVIFTYMTLLVLTRLMGKREISQLTFFDYVVGISLGTIAGTMSIDKTKPLINTLLALIVFGLLQIASSYVSFKNTTLRKIISGTPTVLIKNGKIIERNLLKTRLNIDELTAKLREKKSFRLQDVEFAILETDGKLSVMKKTNKEPVTPSDLGISTEYKGLGVLVIEGGKINGERLKACGLTKSWLMSKLAEQGVYDISKVMFAQVDASGKLYIDFHEEHENKIKQSQFEQILSAKLQKVHSDFLTYYNETENEDTKQLYQECANSIKNIQLEFNNYIKSKNDKNTNS